MDTSNLYGAPPAACGQAPYVHRLKYLAAAIVVSALPCNAMASSISLLNNGDFEIPFTTLSYNPAPAYYGVWAVGNSAQTSLATTTITPHSGLRMYDPLPTTEASIDVYQVVDVSAFAAQIDTGQATLDASAYF